MGHHHINQQGVPCEVVMIPGPSGPPGPTPTNGTDGANAFTLVVTGFTMPAVSGTVVVEVIDTSWMVPTQGAVTGQALAVEFAGTLIVESIPDGSHVELLNLGYAGNAPGGTAIPAGARVGVSGLEGPGGGSPTGALLIANNLSDVADVPTSRNNLGLGTMAQQNANGVAITGGTITNITDLAVADGGTGASTAANARTNLGTAASGLATASGLTVSGPDLILGRQSAGVNQPVEEIPCTSTGRSIISQASVAAVQDTIGKLLPRYGLIGFLTAVDLNVPTSDNAVTMRSSRYRIDKVTVENASVNLTTATAGAFTAAGGAGTTLAADQSLAALSAASKFLDLTLQTIATTDAITTGTLYFRVGTAQGVAATANVWIWGWRFD